MASGSIHERTFGPKLDFEEMADPTLIRQGNPAAPNSKAARSEEFPARLQKAKKDLQKLEQAIRQGELEVDSRVLHEFRQAVDSVRLTAWAVQQWTDLQEQHRDAYSVLPVLTQERIRRATQLNNELALDLDAHELDFDNEGMDNLYHAVERLFLRLARFFKEGETR